MAVVGPFGWPTPVVAVGGAAFTIKLTVNDFDAVVPVVSLNVTVQVQVLDWVLVQLDSTLISRVIEVSELTVTALFQLLSPLFQI